MKQTIGSVIRGPILLSVFAIVLFVLSGGCGNRNASTTGTATGTPHQLVAGEDGKTHVMQSSSRSRKARSATPYP